MSRKKSIQQEKLQGLCGFERHYAQLYGGRWETLRNSLTAKKNDTEWFVSPECRELPAYRLDRASVLAALSLPVRGAKNILDMCAAPGGKSLVIASMMDGEASLVCNERSHERMMRLVRVVDEHMDKETRSRVSVACADGAKLCLKQTECYDRILLDAPCSSERHVISSETHLAKWSPSRTKTLAVAQWALLSCAYRLLKAGGMLLYATCALSPLENDGVVGRLQKKFGGVEFCDSVPFAMESAEKAKAHFDGVLPPAERTEFGFHVLPDSADGAGPLYFSLIKKTSL